MSELVHLLPGDLPAALFVTIHIGARAPSVLPTILDRVGPLSAGAIEDGDPIEIGRIYCAPPDRHLMIERGRLRCGEGPADHHHRPAIDPLFTSAAEAYGPRVVGVLLSGMLEDGIRGLAAIRDAGGAILVQSPADALFPSLPETAIHRLRPDRVLPVQEIAACVLELVTVRVPGTGGL